MGTTATEDGDKPPGNETTDGVALANTGTPCQFLAPSEYQGSNPPNYCHVLGNQSSEGNLRVMVADGLLATQRFSDGVWVRQFYTYSGAVIVVDGEKTSLGYFNNQPDPTGSFWGSLTTYEAPVSQSISNDGRTVTTVWQVNGLEISQDVVLSSDTDQFYRLDWEITNEGGGTVEDVHFLRGEDTYLAGGDFGNGFWNGATNTVGVTKTVDGVQQRLSFQGITDPDGYRSAFYATLISDVESGSLDNSVDTSFHDNGYALEWQRNALSPGNTWTIRSVESFARSSLSVSGGGAQTLDGTSGTFGLNVSNFGQDPLAVSYTVDCPTGISCTTPPDETIDPGETSEVSVTAEVSDSVDPGTYELVLTALAEGVQRAQGIGVLTVEETDDTDDTDGTVVESRFDTDAEGWTVVGDAQGGSVAPDHRATGGNPGGHIVADDDVAGGTWYWNAPDAFLGDKSGAYDRTLSYDLRVSATDSQFSNADVILEGDGTTLVYDHGDASTHPGTDWTHYEVRLDESAGWTVEGTGAAPNRAQFQSVLSSLSALQIRGEYREGSDTGRLDNVVLVVRDTTVTLQPASASIAPGGTTSVDVVVDGIDDGVGSYVLNVNSEDTSVVRVTDGTNQIGGSTQSDVAADGSSIRIGAFAGNTADSGPVTVATIDLAADSSTSIGSTANLTISITSVSDETGNQYTITDSTGATVTVGQVGPEVVPGSPAQDPDNDGLYEDVNGDGDATPGDATVLFNAVFDDNPAVMDNVPLFDFNGDGDATPGDATALFNEIFG